jgi:hypothetical protein
MEPALALAYLRFGLTFEQKRMFSEATQAFQRAVNLSKGSIAVTDLAHLRAISGQTSEALKALAALQAQPTPPSYGIALV